MEKNYLKKNLSKNKQHTRDGITYTKKKYNDNKKTPKSIIGELTALKINSVKPVMLELE